MPWAAHAFLVAAQVAKVFPGNWFNTNPMHCLRSRQVLSLRNARTRRMLGTCISTSPHASFTRLARTPTLCELAARTLTVLPGLVCLKRGFGPDRRLGSAKAPARGNCAVLSGASSRAKSQAWPLLQCPPVEQRAGLKLRRSVAWERVDAILRCLSCGCKPSGSSNQSLVAILGRLKAGP